MKGWLNTLLFWSLSHEIIVKLRISTQAHLTMKGYNLQFLLPCSHSWFQIFWSHLEWKIEGFSQMIHVDEQTTANYSHAVCVCVFFFFLDSLNFWDLRPAWSKSKARPHRQCAGQRPASRCTCPWRSLRWPAGGAAERRGRSWETWGWSGWSGI